MSLGTKLNKSKLCPTFGIPEIFPPIEEEFAPHKHLFKGKILNAGAGHRDISNLVNGELFNQDIPHGLHNGLIHIYSPLHEIPKPDGFFDVIICNAVLEHVINPDEVIQEFARVCKPGGILLLAVPFLQPEHKDPTDYQRYTADGLSNLINKFGFDVEIVEAVHNVYSTLSWIIVYWLSAQDSVRNFILKCILYPILKRGCRSKNDQIFTVASCYRVIGRRRQN
jgi:SAM-dependent methyltransferase